MHIFTNIYVYNDKNDKSCLTLQADMADHISVSVFAADLAGRCEDQVLADQSEERQSRLQLQRHPSIPSGHHLQPESIQARELDGRLSVDIYYFLSFSTFCLRRPRSE